MKSVTDCVQGRFYQKQSALPAQNNAVVASFYDFSANNGVAFLARDDGVLLGSTDRGATWVVTGPVPSDSSRNWTLLATCPFGLAKSNNPGYGVIAADASNKLYVGRGTGSALPTVWTQILNVSSAVPAFGAPLVSIACAGGRRHNSYGTFSVLVATSESVWLAVADTTGQSDPVITQMYWAQQTGAAFAGAVFTGVAATVAGQNNNEDQILAYAVAYNGGVNAASLTVPKPGVSGPVGNFTWTTVVATLPSPSADVVSISLAGQVGNQGNPSVDWARIIIAIRGGGVYSGSLDGKSWSDISPPGLDKGDWKRVVYTSVTGESSRALALLSNGTVYVTGGPPSTSARLVRARVDAASATDLTNAGNPMGAAPLCSSATVLLGSATGSAPVICAQTPSSPSVGNSTYYGTVSTASSPPGAWPASPGAGQHAWVDMAMSADGSTIIAIDRTANSSNFLVSKTRGQSWSTVFKHPSPDCTSVACDASCTKVVAICGMKVLYSTDSAGSVVVGPTLLSYTFTRVALSPDGAFAYFAVTAGGSTVIYTTPETGAYTRFYERRVGRRVLSIAAGNGSTAIAGADEGAFYITRDAFATYPGAGTLPRSSDGIYPGNLSTSAVSQDGKTFALYASGTASLYLRSCNGTVLSCDELPHQAAGAGPTAAIALSADGTRIALAPTQNPGLVQSAGRFGDSFVFGAGAGPINTPWRALATSADGSRLFAAATDQLYEASG